MRRAKQACWNDCDGEVDEGLLDCDDGDPFTVDSEVNGVCVHDPIDLDQVGFRADVDCDDSNAAVVPGAPETENGIDDDCDGEVDEGFGGG